MAHKAWHKAMEPIHHTHPHCRVGKDAMGVYQRSGTGGKPLCEECARLHAEDRAPSDEATGDDSDDLADN